MVKILNDLEARTGYKSEGYAFPYNKVSVYREVLESYKAVFVSDTSSVISQMIPEAIRPLAGVIIKAMGSPPGIYAPLKRQGRTFGILNIIGRELTPEDIPAVEAFANHISIALENARLFEALRETEKNATEFQEKLRTLHEVNFELSGIESLDDLYHAAVEAALKKLGFERFALFLIEGNGKYLVGTYGTDEKGRICDEHHVKEEIDTA
jgi:K+-sensing histidine kinase KdpD